jgi:transcriptional regulator with XRE-family HTH domain
LDSPSTPGQIVGRNVRAVREEQLLSQRELAERSGVAKITIATLELGRSAHPRRRTVEKLAGALSIPVDELLGEDLSRPKGEAPPLQRTLFNGLGEERRGDVTEALGNYILARAEKREREIEDPQSPYFRTATAAALWLSELNDEARMWSDWLMENASILAPPPANELEAWRNAFELTGALLVFYGLAEQAEQRIAQLNDVPDELARKRLANTTTAAQVGRRRIDQLRAANG